MRYMSTSASSGTAEPSPSQWVRAEERGQRLPERGLPNSSGVMDRVALVPMLALFVLLLASMINPIQPASEDRMTGLNPLVLVKLAVAGSAFALGGLGLLQSQTIRRTLLAVPGILLCLLAITLVATSLFARGDSAMISRASSLIFFGYFLFSLTGLATAGLRDMVRVIAAGVSLFLVVTWAVFLLLPSIGVFYEYTTAGGTVPRMGGTNHPNSIAREAIICLLLCVAMLRSGPLREPKPMIRMVLYAVVLLSLATIVVTYSRTSILAGAIAFGAMMFDRLWSRFGAVLITGCGVVALLGILMVGMLNSDASESAVSAVTKSGDVEELTSFTGRTTIWAEAIDWIEKRPLTGWGLDSAASIMSEEAIGTHNLLLHVTFSGGVFAGLIVVGLLILTLFHAAGSREPLFRAIATYVLLSGLVEDTLIESFPAMLTLLWMVMLLRPAMDLVNPSEVRPSPNPEGLSEA